MERVLPSKVEAVLLFDEYAEFGPRQLLALVNEISEPFGHVFKRTQHENSPGYLNYFSNGISIEVTHSDGPLAPEGFAAVLESGFTNMVFPDAADEVATHKNYVFIAVTHCGVSPNDPDGNLPPLEPKEDMDSDQFDFAIQLLKNLTLVYASLSKPNAIHWLQSNKLLTLKQFAALALDPKDISLLIHPSLFSSGAGENDIQLVGLRTYGAACLIGKEIIFEEVPVAAEILFDRVLQFISRANETGWMIPDGDTFGLDENEAIRVHHIDDEHDEQGVVQLVFERSESLGLEFEPAEDEADDTDGEKIDPEDPVEIALKERLEELKTTEDVTESATGENFEEQESEAMVEPWQGNGRRADIAALRALTQTPSPTVEVEEKRSFWNKPKLGKSEESSSLESAAELLQVEANETETIDEANLEKAQAGNAEPARLLHKVSGLFAKK